MTGITYSDTAHPAGSSPATPLIFEGVNELVQEGYLDPYKLKFPVQPTDLCIFAADEGEIVGVLCYRCPPGDKIAEVTLAYVEPSSRRRGIFSGMWDYLKGVLAPKTRIQIHVSSTNTAATAALLTVRAQPVATTFEG
jgi:ribosomal protein S18 acetylase RimI-like enzyme